MSNITILRTYAQTSPESLPSSILFKSSPQTITIFDAYPKAIFHFLVLPRIQEPDLTASRLDNLKSLLTANKALGKEVILALSKSAEDVKKEIQDEMMERFGFKWDVWIGFHGAPSMHHLHLHVVSADLCSEKLKHKKHYNSFHPKLGFFLHTEEVLSWLEADSTFFAKKLKDIPNAYEPILKGPLSCFHCESEMKNIPTLKAHLQDEWNKLEKRGKHAALRKRKLPPPQLGVNVSSEAGITTKKAKTLANDASTAET